MSKAFDKVWHNALICKLKSYGIHLNLLTLMCNYLCNRQQRVILNGIMSSPPPPPPPQGSVLGPLHFLIFINELPEELVCNPKLFADDVSLISALHDQNSCTQSLRDDIGKLEDWTNKWKMSFNPDPAKPAENVIFTNRNSTLYDTLTYLDVDVEHVGDHKHLGFVLDRNMSSNKHIDEKIAKANQGIGMLRRLYTYLARKGLLQIYKSFIRPHLDYCNVIYHSPTYDGGYRNYYSERTRTDPVNTNFHFINKIEVVQYNASLAITGSVRNSSREKLYCEFGLTSLYDRRHFHRLSLLYKIGNNLIPDYLRQYIPNSVRFERHA